MAALADIGGTLLLGTAVNPTEFNTAAGVLGELHDAINDGDTTDDNRCDTDGDGAGFSKLITFIDGALIGGGKCIVACVAHAPQSASSAMTVDSNTRWCSSSVGDELPELVVLPVTLGVLIATPLPLVLQLAE